MARMITYICNRLGAFIMWIGFLLWFLFCEIECLLDEIIGGDYDD